MNKRVKLFLSFLILFFPGILFAAWQDTLEENFDIVDTFDDLQDWRGQNNLRGYDFDKSHMPKKIDGSDSIWDFYDEWFLTDTNVDWIKFHGTDNVWRGEGKSLRMHLGAAGSTSDPYPRGPSRFGLYFGSDTPNEADGYATSGLANSGYNEVYIFYMVKMSPSIFPTVNGERWPEDDYAWWGYHKFFTVGTAFTDASHINGATDREGTGCRWEYGCSDYLLQWKICGSACEDQYGSALRQVGLTMTYDLNGAYRTTYARQESLSLPFNNFLVNEAIRDGKWFGLEVYVNRGNDQNTDPDAGVGDGKVDVWLYDENGQSYYVYTNDRLIFRQRGTDFAFNKFFFGGNISYWDKVDEQNLDVTYYVDDFIIDGQRIGPTYFSLLSNYQSSQSDVNGDGSVNTQDIQACVNHILGSQDWGDDADVNGDGEVNVTDVQEVVNEVVGG